MTLRRFARESMVTPRGLRTNCDALDDRVNELDDRMRLLDVLTLVIVPIAACIGAVSFRDIVRSKADAPTNSSIARGVVCTWSLVVVAMTKLWHARAQEHTESMKQQLRVEVAMAD